MLCGYESGARGSSRDARFHGRSFAGKTLRYGMTLELRASQPASIAASPARSAKGARIAPAPLLFDLLKRLR
jgi:hypothetical protein